MAGNGADCTCMPHPLQPENHPDTIPPQSLIPDPSSIPRSSSSHASDSGAEMDCALDAGTCATCSTYDDTDDPSTSFGKHDDYVVIDIGLHTRTMSLDSKSLAGCSTDSDAGADSGRDSRSYSENHFPDATSSVADILLPLSSSLRTVSLDEDVLAGMAGPSHIPLGARHKASCRRAASCHTISGNLALDPLITCKLCLCECKLQDMHKMHMCACVYCKKCLQQYLMVLTEEGAVASVTCPDAACKDQGKIMDEEIQHLVDATLYNKYKKVKFMKEVELDPNRAWCPRVGCETVCHEASGSDRKHSATDSKHLSADGKQTSTENTKSKGKKMPFLKGRKFHCPKCGLLFCSVCKAQWHGRKPCSKLARRAAGGSGRSKGPSHILDMLGIQRDDSDEAAIKRCPFCHIPIERDAGCAQMMCKNCQHVFCWYCLANLDNDFLLRHYDKGPCKNKLGHSRTTVIFHRAQIVCVFAGFGFLLLLASPFLLLVAPCILCCKSKWGSMCDDMEDLPDF